MSDAERAREIAGECIWQRMDAATAPCDQLPSVSRCGPCALRDRILAALAAARAEEREAAARTAEKVYRDEPDGLYRDCTGSWAATERTRRIAAAIRAGGGTSTASPR